MGGLPRRTFLSAAGLGILGTTALASNKAYAAPNDTPEVRIHFIAPDPVWRNQDAIVIEIRDSAGNVSYGLVDGGYGSTWATSDPSYVNRYKQGSNYNPERLADCYLKTLSYLTKLDINADNVAFYLGTHPHSDHIGFAQELIYTYRPKVVYTPEYRDEFLNPSTELYVNIDGELVSGINLYDNQYYYDRLVAAAHAIDVPLVTTIETHAGEPSLASDVAGPAFSVAGVEFEIMNYDPFYKRLRGSQRVGDCNDFCWGLKIRANGRTAFLGGDINNTWGAEECLAGELGHVDILKLGHHGLSGSSTRTYLEALSPSIAVATGSNSSGTSEKLEIFATETNTAWFTTHDAEQCGLDALIVTIGADGSLSTNLADTVIVKDTPLGRCIYTGGRWAADGWHHIDGNWYWLQSGVCGTGWQNINRTWYHFEDDGTLTLGWVNYEGNWYYMQPSGYWAYSTFIEDAGAWYYLDSSGVAAKGWKLIDGAWYYFDEGCALQTSRWIQWDGAWYWLGAYGSVKTNDWVSYLDKWYWLGPDGRVLTSAWISYKSKWYWVGPDGVMQTNTWVDYNGTRYWLDGDGVARLRPGIKV